MSVIVVGGRLIGKTSTLCTLMEPGIYVRAVGGEDLINRLRSPDTREIAGTDNITEYNVRAIVDLPTGRQEMEFIWVDTPGEFWSNPAHRNEFPRAWEGLKQKVYDSRAVILLIPPYRDLVPRSYQNAPAHLQPDINTLPTTESWLKQIVWWFDFLRESSPPRLKQINVLMHKADLFADLKEEKKKFTYSPTGRNLWSNYEEHVVRQYYTPAKEFIERTGDKSILNRTNFFITSTQDRHLLELPWLSLSPYILYDFAC
jgi:hypothetical protein